MNVKSGDYVVFIFSTMGKHKHKVFIQEAGDIEPNGPIFFGKYQQIGYCDRDEIIAVFKMKSDAEKFIQSSLFLLALN